MLNNFFRLTFGLFISLTLLSCSNSQTKNTLKTDSLNSEEVTNASAKRDTSEEDKAIGNINFFLSSEAYDKEIEKFLKPLQNGNNRYSIGDYTFSFVEPQFYEDKLFFVRLFGREDSYQDFD